jgi:hypothetical protein
MNGEDYGVWIKLVRGAIFWRLKFEVVGERADPDLEIG